MRYLGEICTSLTRPHSWYRAVAVRILFTTLLYNQLLKNFFKKRKKRKEERKEGRRKKKEKKNYRDSSFTLEYSLTMMSEKYREGDGEKRVGSHASVSHRHQRHRQPGWSGYALICTKLRDGLIHRERHQSHTLTRSNFRLWMGMESRGSHSREKPIQTSLTALSLADKTRSF